MYLIQLDDKQMEKMVAFLDSTLKRGGIEVLTDVVDVYNIISSASKVEPMSQVTPEEYKKNQSEKSENVFENLGG